MNFFEKFFKGFSFWKSDFWGKIIFYGILFLGFNFVVDSLIPRIKRDTKIETIETYNEASENKLVRFYGIRISRFGLGVTWE